MSSGSAPSFTLPRASFATIAEASAAYGWSDLPRLSQPRVLDIGAGVGAFAVMASLHWPGARLTCYEPDADVFAQLEKNVRDLPVECRNHGIRDAATQLFPCDVLKVDAEGAELEVLGGYEHLGTIAVLLVVTRGGKDLYEIERLASNAGLAPAGYHQAVEGGTTLRFVRRDGANAGTETEGSARAAAAEPDEPVRARDRRLHLYISLLTGGGQIWGDVEHCLHELRALLDQEGVGLTLMRDGTTGVDRSRNRQSERALAIAREGAPHERPTHILQLDDDIVFNPRDILKLMLSNMDVTAIVYPRKEIDWHRVARAVMAGATPANITKYESPFVMNFVNGQGVRHPDIGSLLEVEEVGTGCLMMKVEALERYIAAYEEELEYVTDYTPRGVIHHQVFHCERDPACPRETTLREMKRAAIAVRRAAEAGRPDELECAALFRAARAWSDTVGDPTTIGRYLTEDYSFCRRWRLLGGKIHVLLEGELGHVGTYVYRGSLATAVPIVDRNQPGT
ncbi:MAG TPA: hypothetical protein VGG39_30340 [Polyangiaceae bacterium]|jgi:hypothetical protein